MEGQGEGEARLTGQSRKPGDKRCGAQEETQKRFFSTPVQRRAEEALPTRTAQGRGRSAFREAPCPSQEGTREAIGCFARPRAVVSCCWRVTALKTPHSLRESRASSALFCLAVGVGRGGEPPGRAGPTAHWPAAA